MSFNPVDLWNTMTPLAKGVALLLVIMSIYSLTVAVERFIYYAKAKKQSLQFAVLVTGFLKKDQIQEAIDSSKRFKNSHDRGGPPRTVTRLIHCIRDRAKDRP